MSTEDLDRTEKLFVCIGEIDDDFVTEAEEATAISQKVKRKRLYKYGAIASGVVAVAYILFRNNKKSSVAA